MRIFDFDGKFIFVSVGNHPAAMRTRNTGGGALTPWSFNQTVLLRKQRSGASVLVWTGIGGVALLGLWAVTAPLAETIAVEGKLEPRNSTKRVDAPVPGVVEAVLVKEGQAVRKGDPLVRFDLREPRSRLQAAESVRQRLLNENQIAAATLSLCQPFCGEGTWGQAIGGGSHGAPM